MEEYYFQLLRWGSLRKEQIWREKKIKTFLDMLSWDYYQISQGRCSKGK